MNWDVISIILNFVLGGGLLAVFTIKAKKDQATAETDKVEMDNFRTGTDLLMESIVRPLKKELADVRSENGNLRKEVALTRKELSETLREVRRLRRVIEHITDCPHAQQCPVRAELKNEQTNTDK